MCSGMCVHECVCVCISGLLRTKCLDKNRKVRNFWSLLLNVTWIQTHSEVGFVLVTGQRCGGENV